MLLARQRPLAGRFIKATPVETAKAPKPRGFGARRKLAAAPLKSARSVPAADGAIADDAAEAAQPTDWASSVDWVGGSAEPAAPRANGHAPDAFVEELPVPAAIPSVAPELRTLN